MWASAVRRLPECPAIDAGTTEGVVRMKYLFLLYADENGFPAPGSPRQGTPRGAAGVLLSVGRCSSPSSS